MLKRLRGGWGGAGSPASPVLSAPGAEPHAREFEALVDLFRAIPAVAVDEAPSYGMHSRMGDDGQWSLVFFLDSEHPLAEAVDDRLLLATSWLERTERFPPLMLVPLNPPDHVTLDDGAVVRFFAASDDATSGHQRGRYRRLSLCTTAAGFSPDDACRWLTQKLPRPLDDHARWLADDDTAHP